MRHFFSMFLVFVVCLFVSSMVVLAEEYKTYEVKAGDSLWEISQKHKVNLKELKQINALQSDLIHIGTVLKLPISTNSNTSNQSTQSNKAYQVKKGDSLWTLARTHHTSISEIKKVNHLNSDLLLIGQKLKIPPSQKKTTLSIASYTQGEQDKMTQNDNKTSAYTDEEYQWLAKIIEAEAGNQPYLGKVAVASVVMNRKKDDWFPDSIESVIFQKVKNVYQFTPVSNGRIYKVKPSKDAYKAALEALEGADPTKGALFFYNPQIAKDKWIRSRQVTEDIGQHRFAL